MFKRLLIIFIIGFAITLNSHPKVDSKDRQFIGEEILSSGNIEMKVTNSGILGNGGDGSWPSLEWPLNSEIDYLFNGTLWFGAKKIRRDEDGNIYFWLPNPTNQDDVVTQFDSLWTPDLDIVVDTLTSVGYDGDSDLYELLPAYNPLEMNLIGQLYPEYNSHDVPVKCIGHLANEDDDNDSLVDEDELGSPFIYPDPTGVYCYSKPNDEDGDGLLDEDSGEPGFQTIRTYCYDFSPFGFDEDRDYGGSSGGSHHYSLNIAIQQNFYSWPVEQYTNCIVVKTQITNTSLIDTLFDYTYGFFVDADVGPQYWSSNERSLDDISSYNSDNEFAFTYDEDGDQGLTPGYFGFKSMSQNNLNIDCWYWNRGQGPDDYNPLNVYASPTANEKYWLLTGRNPDDSKYISLRDNPQAQIGNPADTRFLYTIYGDMQGFNSPTQYSLNLAPQESIEFYSLITMGNSEQEMVSQVDLINDFINSGFDYSSFAGMKSLPFLFPLEQVNDNDVKVKWTMLTDPDEFYLYYKKVDEPATNWIELSLDHNLGEYIIEDLEYDNEYIFKIGVLFDDVYLESNYETVLISPTLTEENIINVDEFYLQNHPNPFNPSTTIEFSLQKESEVELIIYNIKGQKVKHLVKDQLSYGNHSFTWSGRDDHNNPLTSGVYYYKLSVNGETEAVKKCLLLK